MIYDVVGKPFEALEEMHRINGGQLIAFPVELRIGQALLFDGQQILEGTQDHSLRTWISHEPSGSSIGRGTSAYWHLNRQPGEVVTLHDHRVVPEGRLAIATLPGRYYLNVLNLTNGPNAFHISLTVAP